jgi:hypothetical protein
VINENGTIEQMTNYYPFSSVVAEISTNQSLQPYKFNGKEVHATAHTHGAYDKELKMGNDVFPGITKDGNFLEGDETRKTVTDKTKDIGSSNISKLSDYVVTPNGSLQYYDPSTGKVRLVSRDMPKDGNDPNKIDDAMKLYK